MDENDDFERKCTRIDLRAQKELESGRGVKRRENTSIFRENLNISHFGGFWPFSRHKRGWRDLEFRKKACFHYFQSTLYVCYSKIGPEGSQIEKNRIFGKFNSFPVF